MTIIWIALCILSFYAGLRKGRIDALTSAYIERRVVGGTEIAMIRSPYAG